MAVDKSGLSDSPVGPATAAELLRGRRSVDQFWPDEIPGQTLIREAIEVARWAPNHHLTEPWRFYILGERAKTAIVDLNARLVEKSRGPEVAAAKRRRWSSVPGWLAVTCCSEAGDDVTAREDYAACACAVQNLMLYLHSAGVASKWTSGAVTREPAFLRILGAEAGEYCVGLIWYGFVRRRPRTQRHAVSTILRVID